MKRKIVKSLLFAFVICSVSALMMLTASAKTITKNKLVYEIKGNTATVVDCLTNKKTVTVPSKVGKYKVTAIGEWAFSGRARLTKINLPSTLKTIGTAAFNECTGLKKVVIPSSVTRIRSSAFWYCTSLKTVIIPDSVTKMGKSVFEGCEELTAYVVKGSKAEKYIKKQKHIALAYRYMTSLSLNKKKAELEVGKKLTLKATLKPKKLYNSSLTWSSSNPEVATVSKKGVVKALSEGTAVITCKAKDGSKKSAACTLNVKAVELPVETKTYKTMEISAPGKISGLTVLDIKADGYTLSWDKTDCSGYIISRYNPETEKWITVGDTAKTSYKIQGRPFLSEEQYRVTAYNLDKAFYIYGKASDAVAASTLELKAPCDITVNKSDEKGVTLSWQKADNATGYRVYSIENGEYKYLFSTKENSGFYGKLEPGKEYTITLSSYLKWGSRLLESPKAQETVTVKAPPAAVKEIICCEEKTSYDSLTLMWEASKGADTYQLYIYDKSVGEYVLYKTTAETSAEITELDHSREYTFKITACSGSLKSAQSRAYSFKTAYVPSTIAQAAEQFNSTITSMLTSEQTFSMYRSFSATVVSAQSEENYEEILQALTETETEMLDFVDGVDKLTGATASQAVTVCDELTLRDISSKSFSVRPGGSGYTLTMSITGEKAKEMVRLPDFGEIAEENEAFILNKASVGTAQVKTKLVEGRFETLTIKAPLTLLFTLDGVQYETELMLSQTYFI